jgi:hypothetical protein
MMMKGNLTSQKGLIRAKAALLYMLLTSRENSSNAPGNGGAIPVSIFELMLTLGGSYFGSPLGFANHLWFFGTKTFDFSSMSPPLVASTPTAFSYPTEIVLPMNKVHG